MDTVVRALVVYLFLLIVFRLAGKRTLSETSSFDLVLLLIISETTQQAMVAEDHSMTNGAVLVLTLVGVDILLSLLKQWYPPAEAVIDGLPVVIVKNGKLLQDRMNRERVDEADVMEAARMRLGLESLAQIKYAVLEKSGDITVIPRDDKPQ
jgi:uncharacterized membrane protein YcaP (DUF421 family)